MEKEPTIEDYKKQERLLYQLILALWKQLPNNERYKFPRGIWEQIASIRTWLGENPVPDWTGEKNEEASNVTEGPEV